MSTPSLRLGIDLGGTKIEAALVDAQGTVVWRKRMATPRDDYAATLTAIHGLVQDARHDHPDARNCSVGIGIPGSLSPRDGCVRNANSVWLNGQPLKADLGARLGHAVSMANDANCLARSEATDGAGKGAASVFAVVLGTGVGGAHIVQGHLLVGANGIAGEWGHTPLPWMRHDEQHRPPCWCGRSGCIETFLSGPALIHEFNSMQPDPVSHVHTIVERAASGDAAASQLLERFYDRLARALAMVITIVDPDVIVIGGGLSNITEMYSEVPRRWATWVFSDTPVTTRLVPARHGDSSGVRGAAWL